MTKKITWALVIIGFIVSGIEGVYLLETGNGNPLLGGIPILVGLVFEYLFGNLAEDWIKYKKQFSGTTEDDS